MKLTIKIISIVILTVAIGGLFFQTRPALGALTPEEQQNLFKALDAAGVPKSAASEAIQTDIKTDQETGCSWYQVFCHLRTAVQWTILNIGYLIGRAIAFFITFAGSLITILINSNANILNNNYVLEGFKISLSLANLGFVLAIILIAFGTILRVERYEFKRTLSNLVIAALLINFSFAIAGTIIDFTNATGQFFFNAIEGQSAENFASNFASALNLNKLTPQPLENPKGSILAFGDTFLKSVVSLIAMITFAMIVAIVFLGFAGMLAIRMVYIAILLIVMPIAWLFWTIPELSGQFQKWWSKFLQWTFFFPAAAFFLYLAIVAQQQLGQTQTTTATTAAANLAGWGTGVIDGLLTIFLQVAIMVGGLVAANAIGISGASGALAMAGKVKGWAIGAVGKYTGANLAGRMAAKGAASLTNTPKKYGARLLSKVLSKVPGAGGLANKLAGAGQRKEEIEEYQKNNLSNLSDNRIKEQFKSPSAGTIAKSAIFAEASKRKLIPDTFKDMEDAVEKEALTPDQKAKKLAEVAKIKKELLTSYAKALQATNPDIPKDKMDKIPEIKELANIDPKLVSEITGKNVSEIVKKADPSKLAESLSASYIKSNQDVIQAMDEVQLKTFKRMAKSKDQLDAVRGQLEKATGGNLARLNSVIRDSSLKLQEAKKFGSDQEINDAKAILKQTTQAFGLERGRSSIEQLRAYDKLASFNQVIGDSEIT
ncbi:MAG: hypothetical protein A3I24_02955 [Candidatus Harrisonbacteria bacterium RIFCSPLOWO2_02_FULL_41_13b]|uniref:TrbL/VirB6 plasmid conjugal transfer protein n=1 Tax=Candidatus Harrisonbacteria bacterium RIFCSPLOWO2_02_FULL_41_13b TaxID=1798409 RepID=A0A1G1ZTX1_9BACT|nr:MAG: hypothetical protein A3I24_02955 [Candidatus Harrisonbacteria bacterium RIFCSPLOWO2_02_FULL_41_13b]